MPNEMHDAYLRAMAKLHQDVDESIAFLERSIRNVAGVGPACGEGLDLTAALRKWFKTRRENDANH